MKSQVRIFYLICFALAVVAVVVVLGAFTRLVHAGLGCPDWPTCYGHLWIPNEAHEIEKANLQFADTPVEVDKTWPEQIHRIFASSLGLIVLALFAMIIRSAMARDRSFKKPAIVTSAFLGVLVFGTVLRVVLGDGMDPILWILLGVYFANLCYLFKSFRTLFLPSLLAGMVILQGLFGMWTVTLYLWPQVVTAHLLGGFTVFALLVLLLQQQGQRIFAWGWHFEDTSIKAIQALRAFALSTLVLLIVQIFLGGWTSANYAALACPDFPTCQGQWWPDTDFVHGFNFGQDIGPNYLGGLMEGAGRTAIHMSHRLLAILLSIATIFLCVRLFRSKSPEAKPWAAVLFFVLLAQISLGLSNIYFGLPLAVAVAHNAGGAALLAILVLINHRIAGNLSSRIA